MSVCEMSVSVKCLCQSKVLSVRCLSVKCPSVKCLSKIGRSASIVFIIITIHREGVKYTFIKIFSIPLDCFVLVNKFQ